MTQGIRDEVRRELAAELRLQLAAQLEEVRALLGGAAGAAAAPNFPEFTDGG